MVFKVVFLLLLVAMASIRMTWALRARVLEPGAVDRPEGAAAPWVRLLVLPVWVALVASWFVAPDWITWALLPLPDAVRWGGAAVAVLGLVLLFWVHRSLDRNFSHKLRIREDHTLVTHGPYHWVRHPMYTAFLLLMTGFFLLSGHLVIGVSGLVMLAAILGTRTPREEAMMLERFGDAYRAYMARTGALLPRVR